MEEDYWRPIPGFSNYRVSRRGEVWSLVRNKMLAQVKNARGYLLVNLYRNGKPRNFLIHRLVAMAFIGSIPPGWEVNHQDGDHANNCVENLEIVTPEDNRRHAAETGLLCVGEDNPSARLTEADVREIRRLRDEGTRVRDVAHRYDVSERTVYMACRGLTWKHVT